jgi:triosephosphate isomerase
MFFINFKTYPAGTGEKALSLVKTLEEVQSETNIKVIPVVQPADIKEATESSKLEIWTQHVDPVEFGSHTGSTLPEAVKEDGAKGTFLNHSEHKFSDFKKLETANKRAKEVGLQTLIFADGIDELKLILELGSDYVSYEPPELVGSSDKSVSTEHPDIVDKAVKIAKEKGIPLIVGAGIHSKEDVKISLELGADGFAVASDVLKAEDPKKELLELVEGYEQV